ncbi:hypothetical protein EDB92DRAFT_745659 [Lactarius akahatsu]|uniref:Smr domain-containing protein n=1 Tax=Lactarius akahatsu TaxID=416441 RepID=A0AAD4LJ16_9AGAM|nr:hypothetical protein EDB92DRAFT_745659 [Lactarius akahatsu]
MPGLKLAFTLAVAAYVIGKYFLSGKDDDDAPLPPPRDSYYPSYPYNSGTTTLTQAQQSHRPPPPPSYTQPPPTTNVYSQTTAKTPAPPDYGRSIQHPGLSYTGTPSQSQPSFNTFNPHNQSTARTSAPHDYGHGVNHSSVTSDYGRAPSHTQPSSTRTQASRPYSSLFDTGRVHEAPKYEDEYGYGCGCGYEDEDEDFQVHSHVPSRVHTRGEPRLPTALVGVSSDPRYGEPASVEDLEFAKKLREQARRKGREMSEARSRAKSAQKKGLLGAAYAHRLGAIAHESEMKELDKRAAKIVFKENNKDRREGGKIDLHGLYVAEAIQVAKDQLQTAGLRGDKVVRLIVGKGLHSDGGEAKIRPALEISSLNGA